MSTDDSDEMASADDSGEMAPADSESEDQAGTVSTGDSRETVPADDGTAEQGTTPADNSGETAPANGISVSDTAVYALIGVITGVVAWLLIPLFGVVTAYAGYQLYEGESRTVVGGAFVVVGLLPVFLWIGLLLLA